MFKKGFTLVELMIVVAIIGILAAIAIPNFIEMQYRAKRSEVPSNVKGIKTSEMGYDAAFDTFLNAAQHPTTTASKVQQPWTGGNADYQKLGWAPDGDVRGQYTVVTTAASSSSGGGDFLVTGICDVDGDSVTANYTATKSINATVNTLNDVY